MPGFTPLHRGGSGPPLVLLHGFLDSWRTWELVLPALERHHHVLAPTLAGHAGGPPLGERASTEVLADSVERAMDHAGFDTAHIAGNSLGGWLALSLAARGRARTVTALAPAGGWAESDDSYKELVELQARIHEQARAAAPHADAILATREGRRRATAYMTTHYEHIPRELLAHQLLGVAACTGAGRLLDYARENGWSLDAEEITSPVRVVWGTADRLLPWPSAAERFRTEWLPQAEWIELDDVGHAPQLDVPVETAELILGITTQM